jgi:hypothetical protein
MLLLLLVRYPSVGTPCAKAHPAISFTPCARPNNYRAFGQSSGRSPPSCVRIMSELSQARGHLSESETPVNRWPVMTRNHERVMSEGLKSRQAVQTGSETGRADSLTNPTCDPSQFNSSENAWRAKQHTTLPLTIYGSSGSLYSQTAERWHPVHSQIKIIPHHSQSPRCQR